jgi:hypothetical protein
MGTVFEDLVRMFNEDNNEEAGQHWTPRDAVKLMASLMFLPVADKIESGTYLLYDCACGTGGMLTVAEETLQQIATAHGKQVATHLYGQEINAETYAICKADLLLKGDGDAADNIVGGPAFSTLSNDQFRSRSFDFMLANPPYGKSWKSDLERMSGEGGKKDVKDPRFVIEHDGDPEFSLITRAFSSRRASTLSRCACSWAEEAAAPSRACSSASTSSSSSAATEGSRPLGRPPSGSLSAPSRASSASAMLGAPRGLRRRGGQQARGNARRRAPTVTAGTYRRR